MWGCPLLIVDRHQWTETRVVLHCRRLCLPGGTGDPAGKIHWCCARRRANRCQPGLATRPCRATGISRSRNLQCCYNIRLYIYIYIYIYICILCTVHIYVSLPPPNSRSTTVNGDPGRARSPSSPLSGRDRVSGRQKSLQSCSSESVSLAGRGWRPGRLEPLGCAVVGSCNVGTVSGYQFGIINARTINHSPYQPLLLN